MPNQCARSHQLSMLSRTQAQLLMTKRGDKLLSDQYQTNWPDLSYQYQNGHTLLSDQFQANGHKLSYQCQHGHKLSYNFQHTSS